MHNTTHTHIYNYISLSILINSPHLMSLNIKFFQEKTEPFITLELRKA